jgi:hypothetical protein
MVKSLHHKYLVLSPEISFASVYSSIFPEKVKRHLRRRKEKVKRCLRKRNKQHP